MVDRFELEAWEKKVISIANIAFLLLFNAGLCCSQIRGFVTQKAELDKEVAAKNKEAELANALAKRLEEKLRLATIEVSTLNSQAAIADDKFKQVLREKTALVAQNAALTKKLGDLKQRHDQLDIEVQSPSSCCLTPCLLATMANDSFPLFDSWVFE